MAIPCRLWAVLSMVGRGETPEGLTEMKFGFTVMADIDEIGFFSHAEALGYNSVWVADSQMLFSDCYAVLALAARQTSRLRIGPGTAICGTRIPPVQVAAVATLNRIAPGRVFLGIGTGNTAMRSMGQRPMRIAEFAEYLRVLAALLRGEVVDYTFNDVTRPISMLMHGFKYMDLEPKIPLYVSGFGPRAMGLAGNTAMGWCSRSRRAAFRSPRRWAMYARAPAALGAISPAFAMRRLRMSRCCSRARRSIPIGSRRHSART